MDAMFARLTGKRIAGISNLRKTFKSGYSAEDEFGRSSEEVEMFVTNCS
jgi:hypothetical protein